MPKKKTVEDVVNESNIAHNHKYDYTKSVYVGTHVKMCIICPEHQTEFWQAPMDHIRGITGCNQCKAEKTILTNVERYGCHPSQIEEVKVRGRATNTERYGVDNPLKSDDIRAKGRATNVIRLGVENPFCSLEIQEKRKTTNLLKFGVEHPLQSEEIRNKMKVTMIARHGVENSQQSEEIRDKSRATNLEKYRCEYHTQQHMIGSLPLLQSKEWLEDQYVTQGKTLTQIGKELGVGDSCVGNYAKMYHIEIRPNEIGSSYQEREWIEGIMESEGIFIQYEGNGGQYNIPGTRWKADGYCADNNTIYEFHGSPWHGNPRMNKPHPKDKSITAGDVYQKTKEREQRIIDLGYNLVVMWDDGFTYKYEHTV